MKPEFKLGIPKASVARLRAMNSCKASVQEFSKQYKDYDWDSIRAVARLRAMNSCKASVQEFSKQYKDYDWDSIRAMAGITQRNLEVSLRKEQDEMAIKLWFHLFGGKGEVRQGFSNSIFVDMSNGTLFVPNVYAFTFKYLDFDRALDVNYQHAMRLVMGVIERPRTEYFYLPSFVRLIEVGYADKPKFIFIDHE